MGETREPAVSFREVSKNFGGVQALKSIDLDIYPGTVHAFVGENGAGKSTALGIIAGRIQASHGTFTLFGEDRGRWDPRLAARAGVASIYQELTIIPGLTPAANVYLGYPITRNGLLAERRMRAGYVEMCSKLGVAPSTAETAGELSVAEQQLIEIMRAIVREPRVILFDEPTAALAESERALLHELIRSLRRQGLTILLVSHNLEEVLDLSDEVTVFRDGQVVASRPASAWSRPSLVSAMLGHGVDSDGNEALAVLEAELSGNAPRPPDEGRADVTDAARGLRIEGVTRPGVLEDIELEVRAGEIVGVAGLVGSGRTSLLRAIAGADAGVRGRMWIDGREVGLPRSPRAARGLGIALIPEDRKHQGLALSQSAADNIALGNLRRVAQWRLFLRSGHLHGAVEPSARDVAFNTARLRARASELSGGNQQKLLFARWQFERPRVLLVDEPTRGVDVGAKAEILGNLKRTAHEEGMAVIVVSSELEEVIALSDRIIVLAHGRKVREVSQADGKVSADELLHSAFASVDGTPVR